MTKNLIKFKANWSDEFDCEQFIVTSHCPMCYIEEILSEGAWGFGTNQDFEKLSVDDFEIIALSVPEAAVLEKLFPRNMFGVGVL